MKIIFIGTGSAFAKRNFNSNMLLEIPRDGGLDRMLVDCGRTAPEALAALEYSWADIDAAYISHAHSDHTGALEEFAFMRKFVYKAKPKPKLIGRTSMLHDLWEHTLKGGLGVDKAKPDEYSLTLADYFDPEYVTPGVSFQFSGITFHLVKNAHIMPSYGLDFTTGAGKRVYISTDSTMPKNEFGFLDQCDVIFHDAEVSQFKSGVHAHIEELAMLPAAIKAKMWLYHYQDVPVFPDAIQMGFAGAVRQGQAFDL